MISFLAAFVLARTSLRREASNDESAVNLTSRSTLAILYSVAGVSFFSLAQMK